MSSPKQNLLWSRPETHWVSSVSELCITRHGILHCTAASRRWRYKPPPHYERVYGNKPWISNLEFITCNKRNILFATPSCSAGAGRPSPPATFSLNYTTVFIFWSITGLLPIYSGLLLILTSCCCIFSCTYRAQNRSLSTTGERASCKNILCKRWSPMWRRLEA